MDLELEVSRRRRGFRHVVSGRSQLSAVSPPSRPARDRHCASSRPDQVDKDGPRLKGGGRGCPGSPPRRPEVVQTIHRNTLPRAQAALPGAFEGLKA